MSVIGVPTLDERIAQIRRRILANNPNDFSVAPGSFPHDIVINTQAASDVQQFAIDFLLGVSQSITDILALEKDTQTIDLLALALNNTSDDVLAQLSEFLDNWGENFSATRLQPTKAVGTVKYCRVDPPTSDITVGIGKVVKTSGGVQFSTTAAATMYAAGAASYFDPVLLLYALEVPVEAVNAGSSGNAPTEAVNTIVTAVAGFSIVINTEPTTGGNDLETDDHYGARLLAKWQAVGTVTMAGVEESATTLAPGVLDAYVAKTGDPLSLRGYGRTDIWVEGENPSQVTETFNAYNDPNHPNSIMPSNRPVLSLVSVDSGSAVLRQDRTSVLSGSVRSGDFIQFTAAPAFPVQVTYIYDSRVAEVQAVFNDPSRAPHNQVDPVDTASALRTPILAKASIAVDVDYTASVMVVPGQNPTTVKAAAANNVAALGAKYLLGESTFLSDVNQAIEDTPGVLRLSGTPTKFAKTGHSGVEDVIATEKNEYIRFLNISIL